MISNIYASERLQTPHEFFLISGERQMSIRLNGRGSKKRPLDFKFDAFPIELMGWTNLSKLQLTLLISVWHVKVMKYLYLLKASLIPSKVFKIYFKPFLYMFKVYFAYCLIYNKFAFKMPSRISFVYNKIKHLMSVHLTFLLVR